MLRESLYSVKVAQELATKGVRPFFETGQAFPILQLPASSAEVEKINVLAFEEQTRDFLLTVMLPELGRLSEELLKFPTTEFDLWGNSVHNYLYKHDPVPLPAAWVLLYDILFFRLREFHMYLALQQGTLVLCALYEFAKEHADVSFMSLLFERIFITSPDIVLDFLNLNDLQAFAFSKVLLSKFLNVQKDSVAFVYRLSALYVDVLPFRFWREQWHHFFFLFGLPKCMRAVFFYLVERVLFLRSLPLLARESPKLYAELALEYKITGLHEFFLVTARPGFFNVLCWAQHHGNLKKDRVMLDRVIAELKCYQQQLQANEGVCLANLDFLDLSRTCCLGFFILLKYGYSFLRTDFNVQDDEVETTDFK